VTQPGDPPDRSTGRAVWTAPNGRQYTPNRQGYITGTVAIDLGDVIDGDLEAFLDLLSEALTGSGLLMDINYRLVGVDDDHTMRLEVTGDPQQIQADDDDPVETDTTAGGGSR
jgi:hypothetical protein